MSVSTSSSTATPTPTPSTLSISSSAVVCIEATLEGPFAITIGDATCIHPKAVLRATHGPIVIASHCIIEELSIIQATDARGITIGSHTVIEVGARIHAVTVGEGTLIQARATAEPLSVIGSGCTIGACITVSAEDTIPDETVLWGTTHQRRTQPGSLLYHRSSVLPKLSLLQDILSKTHKLAR